MRTFYILKALIISFIFTIACENKLDESNNILPQMEVEAGEEEEGGAIVECEASTAGMEVNNENSECVPCPDCPAVGSWYRFDELAITALDGDESHPIKDTLNMLWAGDIERNQLNILFEIIEKTETQIKMRALNAAFLSTDPDDFCLLPETAIEFTFERDQVNGCGFTNPEASGINVYAGSKEIPKNCAPNLPTPHTIPIRNATLSGKFARGCDRIRLGEVLSAAIPKSSLGKICSCLAPQIESCKGPNPNYMGNFKGECVGCESSFLMSLESQLSNFQELQFECEADGGPAACLAASFEAQRLSMTPPICP